VLSPAQRSAQNPLSVDLEGERDGEIKEAVRLGRYIEPSNSCVTDNYVELKCTDGSAAVLRVVWRMLPRHGGRALLFFCPYCHSCARLRYSSEGGHLRGSGRGAIAAFFRASFGNLSRPESWLPYMFTSPEEAAATCRVLFPRPRKEDSSVITGLESGWVGPAQSVLPLGQCRLPHQSNDSGKLI
jgi:hypothetical protein